jgi:hypothetical protein
VTVGNFPGKMTDLNIWNLPIDQITLDNYMTCNDPLFLNQPPALINWNEFKLAKKGNMTYNATMAKSTVCPSTLIFLIKTVYQILIILKFDENQIYLSH